MEKQENNVMEKIISLAKRKGFVFASSEIYGGMAGIYDYGHYGILLKDNIKNAWWKHMIQLREDDRDLSLTKGIVKCVINGGHTDP